MIEIDVFFESVQFLSEVYVVMELISMKDFFGVNLDVIEIIEELMGEEIGFSEECQLDEFVIESVVDDEKVMCNKELELIEFEIIIIIEDRNVFGDVMCVSCEGELVDYVDEGLGDEGLVNLICIVYDFDLIEVFVDIVIL